MVSGLCQVAIAVLLFGVSASVSAQQLTLHALPVSSGNCFILQCPEVNRTLVVDCGTAAGARGGWRTAQIKQYLSSEFDDDSRISVILTHLDYDHYSHFPALLEVFGDRIEAFWFGGEPAKIFGPSRRRIAHMARRAKTINGEQLQFSQTATDDEILAQLPLLEEDYFGSPESLQCLPAIDQTGHLPGTILTANEGGKTKNERSLV